METIDEKEDVEGVKKLTGTEEGKYHHLHAYNTCHLLHLVSCSKRFFVLETMPLSRLECYPRLLDFSDREALRDRRQALR